MSIALVAFGNDSNGTGASTFLGLTQPIGILNGDVVIVAIALGAAGITVTPPSSDWVQLAQTDPTQSFGLSVWYATAMNLPTGIVFALSGSCICSGVIVAYRGVDPFQPVEAFAAALTAASTTHGVSSVTPAQASEEAVLFIAGAASGTYTPASNFVEVARAQRTGNTIEAQHLPLQNAGLIAGFNETFSTSAAGASVLLVLPPSPATTTLNDVYNRVFEALPKGVDNLLDFTPGSGDYWKYFQNVAAIVKWGYDLVDLAKQEVVAYTSRYKLSDWEGIFGLRTSRIAQVGTIPQRQLQVLGSWRAASGQGSTIPTVQAVLAPLLGYLPSTLPQVIEADWTQLRLLHQYGFTGDLVVAAAHTASVTIPVTDGGTCSHMGAQLELLVNTPSALGSLSFTLTGPDGTSVTWNGATSNWPTSPLKLYAPAFATKQIAGNWTLSMTNNSGGSVTLFDGLCLFVEGIARGQTTGGAIYEWGVYADPLHLGENGSNADFAAARAAIKRIAQSHTVGNLIQSLAPYPDVTSGANASIPDEAVPV